MELNRTFTTEEQEALEHRFVEPLKSLTAIVDQCVRRCVQELENDATAAMNADDSVTSIPKSSRDRVLYMTSKTEYEGAAKRAERENSERAGKTTSHIQNP